MTGYTILRRPVIGGGQGARHADWWYMTSGVRPRQGRHRTAMATPSSSGTAPTSTPAPSVSSTMATTHVDFELNRKPFKTGADGVSKPNRSVGDLIISLEFSNGGVNPVVTHLQDHRGHRFRRRSEGHLRRRHPTTLDGPFGDELRRPARPRLRLHRPGLRLRRGLDQPRALSINTSCPGFSNGHIRTRSGGDPGSSQLKDAVAAFPIDLNNCGKLRIEKHAGDDRRPAPWRRRVRRHPEPDPGRHGTLHVVDNGANDGDSHCRPDRDLAGHPGHLQRLRDEGAGRLQAARRPLPCGQRAPNGTATFIFADPRKVAATSSPCPGIAARRSFVAVGTSIHLVSARRTRVSPS